MKICPVCSTEYADDVKFCPNDGQTLRAGAPASDLVGQVVADRYHVVKKLGEGGMGQVYLAEHVKMGRRSAIKVMSPSMVHDPDAVARFNREAANASRITHPNVCAIYDFGETSDGLIYLAMEYIEGEPLTALLAREGALPIPRAADLFLQTADALQAAHDLGIVHRDLKPDNIMVVHGRGGRDVVKVVDFGIAKAVGGDEAGQKVTKTGLVVGTPEFMSPEQLSGDKVDGRSDLYSLALVFYRTLTDELPFKADSVQETMIKRLTDEPAKLDAVRPDLPFPPGLQAVFDTALAKLPSERYQQVSKFAADVGAVTGRGRATGVAPTTRPVDTDARTQVLAPGEAKAAAVAATRPSVPRHQPKRRSLVPVVVGAVVVLGGAGAGVAVLTQGAATPADSTAVPDTSRQAGGTPVPSGTEGGTQPQTTGGGTAPPRVTGGGGTTVPPVSSVDPAGARPALEELFDKLLDGTLSHAAVRDSAIIIYNASAVPSRDRAYAANLVVQTYLEQSDRGNARTWAENALRLAPSDTGYRALVRDLRP